MSLNAWTISYQGRSAREIAYILRENGIESVVHIGTTAADLEGSELEEELIQELDKARIDFQHLEGIGEPPEFRGIPSRGRDEMSSAFNDYLSRRTDQMEQLKRMLEERPTATFVTFRGNRLARLRFWCSCSRYRGTGSSTCDQCLPSLRFLSSASRLALM